VGKRNSSPPASLEHGKTTGEMALLLEITEQAAAKRVSRALGRLRKILLRKNAIVPAVSLAIILDQIPRTSAPAALAKSITLAATAGASAPASAAIANGVMHMLTWHKIAAAFVLIAILSAITGLSVGRYKLAADQTDTMAPPPPPPVSTGDAGQSSPVIAQLSNGVSVQILGINENPSAGNPWWQINGDPIDLDLHADVQKLSVNPGDIAREVVVKVNRAMTGSSQPATVQWYLQHGMITYSGKSNIPDTETIASLHRGQKTTPQIVTSDGSQNKESPGN
jgi:hypothetical protein